MTAIRCFNFTRVYIHTDDRKAALKSISSLLRLLRFSYLLFCTVRQGHSSYTLLVHTTLFTPHMISFESPITPRHVPPPALVFAFAFASHASHQVHTNVECLPPPRLPFSILSHTRSVFQLFQQFQHDARVHSFCFVRSCVRVTSSSPPAATIPTSLPTPISSSASAQQAHSQQ